MAVASALVRVLVVIFVMVGVALSAQPLGAATDTLHPATARGLAAAVVATGIGCTDYEANDPDNSITFGGLPKGDSGDCTIDGESSTLTVYKTKADLQEVLHAIPTTGCRFVKAFGKRTFRFVLGPNWSIATPSSATGPKLARALHAKTFVHHCKG